MDLASDNAALTFTSIAPAASDRLFVAASLETLTGRNSEGTHHFKHMARPKRKSVKRSDDVPSVRKNLRVPRSVQSKSGVTARAVAHSGSGLWDTQKWLIGKKLAHVVNKRLVAAEASQERRDDADGKAKKMGRRSKPIAKRLARRKSI